MNFSRSLRTYLTLHSWPVFLFLYAPLAIIVLFSFNRSPVSVQFTGFSAVWYTRLFHNQDILAALGRSLELGIGSASFGTVLGTLLGYGVYRYRAAGLTWLGLLVYLPIIMPSIVFGISEMIFFTYVHQFTGFLSAGLLTMGVAHVTFQIPYVALVVYSRLVGLDRHLFNAAQDLYANPWKIFFHLVLPVTRPAVVAGFLLAFTLSFDDFVISFFTSGPDSVTLPLYIYGAVAKKGVSPEINAVASLMIGMVLVAAITNLLVSRSKEQAQRPSRPWLRSH